jgi:hypothetical protein
MYYLFHCYVHVCCVIALCKDKYGIHDVWQHCSVSVAMFVNLQITYTARIARLYIESYT